MGYEDERSRSRMQLSRILHGVSMSIEEILGEKTASERVELVDAVFKLVPEGCMSYVNLMRVKNVDIDDSETDRFLFSPHGVSYIDALGIVLEEREEIPLEDHAYLYASLAEILIGEIPYEIRWAMAKNEEFEAVDPLELIGFTVHATNAMGAVQEARLRKLASSMQATKSVLEESVAVKVKEAISENARRNGELAHVENRRMKAEVFEWCEKNLSNFKSTDRAAEAIAGKEQPIVFTTARSWVREWKKKNSLKNRN